MARRRSLVSAFAEMQREATRAQAARLRAEAGARKAADRAHAAYLRAQAADEKERKRLYVESRAAAVAAMNNDLEFKITELQQLLPASLQADSRINFAALKERPRIPQWRHGHLEQPEPPPVPAAFMPPEPTGLSKVFGGSKHQQAIAAGQAAFAQATQQHQQRLPPRRPLTLSFRTLHWCWRQLSTRKTFRRASRSPMFQTPARSSSSTSCH